MSTLPQHRSALGVTAFILALIVPVLGLIISIVALWRAHKNEYTDSFARAGMILGIILTVLYSAVIVILALLYIDSLQVAPRPTERSIAAVITEKASPPLTAVDVEWLDTCNGLPSCHAYDLLVCAAVDLGSRPDDKQIVETAVTITQAAYYGTMMSESAYRPARIGIKLARIDTDVIDWCRGSPLSKLYELDDIRNARLPQGYVLSVNTLYWEPTSTE